MKFTVFRLTGPRPGEVLRTGTASSREDARQDRPGEGIIFESADEATEMVVAGHRRPRPVFVSRTLSSLPEGSKVRGRNGQWEDPPAEAPTTPILVRPPWPFREFILRPVPVNEADERP